MSKIKMTTIIYTKRDAEAMYIYKDLKEQEDAPDKNDTSEYIFKTISKIEGIQVNVLMKTFTANNNWKHYDPTANNVKILYYIETSKIHLYCTNGCWEAITLYNYSNEFKEFSVESVKEVLNHLHETLPKLKLDKHGGLFIIEDIIEDFGNEYQNGEDCCVCYTKTQTQTQCKHHLCLACWSQVVKTTKNCPLCKNPHISVYEEE
jgi:hypothetical protein